MGFTAGNRSDGYKIELGVTLFDLDALFSVFCWHICNSVKPLRWIRDPLNPLAVRTYLISNFHNTSIPVQCAVDTRLLRSIEKTEQSLKTIPRGSQVWRVIVLVIEHFTKRSRPNSVLSLTNEMVFRHFRIRGKEKLTSKPFRFSWSLTSLGWDQEDATPVHSNFSINK